MSGLPATAKIAVIGGGVSGLVAAHRLGSRHAVTLFEANDYIGGHTHTVMVDIDGERHAIDTGFIVFNNRTYPNFVALLDELGVASQPTSMGFSLRCDHTGLEYSGATLNGVFAQRRNLLRPSFHRMLRDILRFNREAVRTVLCGGWEDCRDETTVADYVHRGRYSREFVEHYLLPLGSAIWSCPVGTFAEFPIRFVVEFYQNHGMLSLQDRPLWRVVQGGSQTYVAEILRRFSGQVFQQTPIERVRRFPDRVEVTPRGSSPLAFDHVVFACHADQALRVLADPARNERELLAEFRYEKNRAVLHTDTSLLPRRRRAWASWNYLLSAGSASARSKKSTEPGRISGARRWSGSDFYSGPERSGGSGATVTYCMNILQQIRSKYVFNVTLNAEPLIDPAKILGRFEYDHPVFTARRAAAQGRHSELLNVNRTSYCGAYWRNGFHEDGVVSAIAVCEALRGRPPAKPEPNSAARSPRDSQSICEMVH
jgi:predicted NAD/FAD-binding protein